MKPHIKKTDYTDYTDYRDYTDLLEVLGGLDDIKQDPKFAIHPDLGVVSIVREHYGSAVNEDKLSKVKTQDFYPVKVKFKDLKFITPETHPELFL